MERMNEGQAFIQISTKSHVSGEIRGQVRIKRHERKMPHIQINIP